MTRLLIPFAAVAILSSAALVHGGHVSTPRKVYFAETVADLAASSRWYETMFDARRISDRRSRDGSNEIVMLAGDHLMVELIHFTAPAASDTVIRNDRAVGLKKVGAELDSAAYDSTLARLRRGGAMFVGAEFLDSLARRRTFIVRDPSSNLIQFFTPMR